MLSRSQSPQQGVDLTRLLVIARDYRGLNKYLYCFGGSLLLDHQTLF